METKTIVEKVNTDSINIKKNAKGEFAWEVKAYGDSDGKVPSLELQCKIDNLIVIAKDMCKKHEEA